MLSLAPATHSIPRNLTVLMFHGNAGNIGHRVPIAKAVQDTLQCNVFLLEYRGYGMSTGTPDEAGLKIDAQTGLDYLRQRAETRDTEIVVYGQSLGGAVAINLVAQNEEQGDISGLILENTFLSIRKLIPKCVFCPLLFSDENANSEPVSSPQRGISHASAINIGLAKMFCLK